MGMKPETEAQMYNVASEVLAPYVGQAITGDLLDKVQQLLQDALEPFAALPDVPLMEIQVIQHPDDPQRLYVKFIRSAE
jgi:hypothetical protein